MIAVVLTMSSKMPLCRIQRIGETYTIVNPGEGVNRTIDGYANYLKSLGQAFLIPGYSFNSLNNFGTCPTCPAMPKAVRDYDGLEFRVTKSISKGWAGLFSYTWSRLWGNYTGLTTTRRSRRATQLDATRPTLRVPSTSRSTTSEPTASQPTAFCRPIVRTP